MKHLTYLVSIILSCTLSFNLLAESTSFRLRYAYPKLIQKVSTRELLWWDGNKMSLSNDKPHKTQQEKLNNPSLSDQINDATYLAGTPQKTEQFTPITDSGRIRYEPFFRKIYGNSPQEVESQLVTVYWMPKIFGMIYPLQVTTVNQVDKKFIQISRELEQLVLEHPEYRIFLENPGGTYRWRLIANTNRLSTHSFGMTIDINAETSNYWQWDLLKASLPITEETPVKYQNSIPWEIVSVFEKYGFIWGGKWYHYDTMHFEYRPELLTPFLFNA